MDWQFIFDSDGCVFDTMEPKHRKGLLPALIEVFGLNSEAERAEEIWCRINLYSMQRGINRFPALVEFWKRWRSAGLDLPPGAMVLEDWIRRTRAFSKESLLEWSGRLSEPSEVLAVEKVVEWSDLANRLYEDPSPRMFPGAAEALAALSRLGSCAVVSQSPRQLLLSHWKIASNGFGTARIFGQENGKKEKILERIHRTGSPEETISLFFGDAPSDQIAAAEAGCIFHPIVPGSEGRSWEGVRDWAATQNANRASVSALAGLETSKRVEEFNFALRRGPPKPEMV